MPSFEESICASPPLGNAVPPVECADLSAFSSFISSSFSADQIFNILPLSFDQESTAVPPVQTHLPPSGTEVEINFSPLLNLGVTTPTPLPQIDDLLFTDFLEVPPPVPSPADVEKARQIAHLEALKRHKDHLQKRIQSLYVFLTSRFVILTRSQRNADCSQTCPVNTYLLICFLPLLSHLSVPLSHRVYSYLGCDIYTLSLFAMLSCTFDQEHFAFWFQSSLCNLT